MTTEQTALIDQFAAGADQLRQVLGIVPADRWDVAPAPGEWTARQVLIHLADSEIVGAARFRQFLAEDDVTLLGYTQNAWAERLGYADAAPEEAIALAIVLRRATAALLRRAVTPESWGRVATHPTRGPMDLATLLRLYIGHVDGHIQQLEGIAAL